MKLLIVAGEACEVKIDIQALALCEITDDHLGGKRRRDNLKISMINIFQPGWPKWSWPWQSRPRNWMTNDSTFF